MSANLPLPPIIGVSAAMNRARTLVRKYANTGLSILLHGPTGSGKELFAQHVHHLSERTGDLVPVNCGALPRELAEGLLFGHRRGAFSGACESVPGLVERAHRGTLFLDELLHLPPDSQVKMLRVLECCEVERLGDSCRRRVDLRLVGAVQEDLRDRLGSGQFRLDLYQRVAGVVVHLPPLIERLEDVTLLAAHFAGLQNRILEDGCRKVLENYSWPGNVRELKLAIDRAGYLVENGHLPATALVEAIDLGLTPSQPMEGSVTRIDLKRECVAHGYSAEAMARAHGVHRATLYRWLKAYGLDLRAMRRDSHFVARHSRDQCDP